MGLNCPSPPGEATLGINTIIFVLIILHSVQNLEVPPKLPHFHIAPNDAEKSESGTRPASVPWRGTSGIRHSSPPLRKKESIGLGSFQVLPCMVLHPVPPQDSLPLEKYTNPDRTEL